MAAYLPLQKRKNRPLIYKYTSEVTKSIFLKLFCQTGGGTDNSYRVVCANRKEQTIIYCWS